MSNTFMNDLKIFAKHLTVLICEDDVEVGLELKGLLQIFFKQVFLAKDGEEALVLYKKNRCDIVISDINMPKISGVELSREIRSLNKQQVIIILSGQLESNFINLIDIGIQSLVSKPPQMDDFLQKILDHCENIVLKKELNRINFSILFSKNQNTRNDNISSIAKEIAKEKSIEDLVNHYASRFDIEHSYDEDMWKDIFQNIQELNGNYEDAINNIVSIGFNEEIKQELIKIFSRYNKTLDLIPGISKFSTIFLEVSLVLEQINTKELDTCPKEVFAMFEYFYEDIINFFNVIFANKETQNITHLTNSFKNSVEQLEIKLGIKELEEDELELF